METLRTFLRHAPLSKDTAMQFADMGDGRSASKFYSFDYELGLCDFHADAKMSTLGDIEAHKDAPMIARFMRMRVVRIHLNKTCNNVPYLNVFLIK